MSNTRNDRISYNNEIAKPTEIRLFISSTFVDMQDERERFNNRIFPRLQRLCRDKGVSFFAVDLRWGIAEEDIKNNRLVKLCLDEVDKCRPFFLGIIGNRYGSAMENIPDGLLEEYPWLSEKRGASYTDLEITYHFKKCSDPDNMLFLFKKCQGEVDPNVVLLKGFICEKAKEQIREYDSLDVFEEEIVNRFSLWLNKMIGDTDVHIERERLYERELMAQSTHNEKEEKSVEHSIRISDSSVLLYGQGPLGKTSLLNSIARKWEKSIVINCAADEANGDWRYVVCSIYKKLVDAAKIPDSQRKWFDKLLESGIHDEGEIAEHCRAMLEEAVFERDTLLVINDPEYIFDTRARYLLWIPTATKEHFQIVCSSNHPDFINSAKMLDWTILEMCPMEKNTAAELLDLELGRVGKNPKTAAPLLSGALAGYPGFLKTSIDFLNCFGSYDTIGELASLLAKSSDFNEFYKTIFEYIPKKYTAEAATDLLLTLGAVALSPVALDEAGRYAVLQKINGASKVRWAAVTELLSALRLMYAGGAISGALRNVVFEMLSDNEKKQISSALGEYRLSLADIKSTPYDTDTLKQLVCAISHFADAKNYEAIIALVKNSALVSQLAVFDIDSLRRAYAELLFGCDRNVAKLISNTVAEIAEEESDIKEIAIFKLGFICDELELYDSGEAKKIDAVCTRFAKNGKIPESVRTHPKLAYGVRDRAFDVLQSGKFEKALEIVEELRPYCNTNQKRAAYLNMKAELLLKARRQGVLNNIDQALGQSIRAASAYDILYAYDLKAGELIRLCRYEEAESISLIGLRFAKDMGYVFYRFAFVNHIMVCLYRNDHCEKAVLIGKQYMDYCKRFVKQTHKAVFAIGIALAYNLNGEYGKCIEFAEDQLKSKELIFQHRAHLSEVLAAAYVNDKKYHKGRKILSDMLKEKELDGAKRQLFTLRVAQSYLLEEGSVSAKTAKMFDDAFGMAKKIDNTLTIHMCISQFYPMLISTNEGKKLIEKWGDTENREAYLRRLSNPEKLLFNAAGLISVKENVRAEANISRLENDYTISLNREKREEALSAALALAHCYEATDRVQEARWYLCAAKASEGEKRQKLLVNSVFALMKEGKALDEAMLCSLLEHMEDTDKKAVELWQKIGALPYNDDSTEILSYLDELLNCTKNTTLLCCCIADLAEILYKMSLRELEIFEELALKAELNEMLVSDIMHNGLEYNRSLFDESFDLEDIEGAIKNAISSDEFASEYEKLFGKDQFTSDKHKDIDTVSLITDSGCFTLGMSGPIKFAAQETVGVVPCYDYKNLDNSLGTITVNKAVSILMCTTDIESKYFSMAKRQIIEKTIEKVKAKHSAKLIAACKANFVSYGRVKCEMFIGFESESDLRKKFNEYAKFTVGLIAALDELAAVL